MVDKNKCGKNVVRERSVRIRAGWSSASGDPEVDRVEGGRSTRIVRERTKNNNGERGEEEIPWPTP